MSSAMFSTHTLPFVERPPASGLGYTTIGGASGPPSSLPPSVYESYITVRFLAWGTRDTNSEGDYGLKGFQAEAYVNVGVVSKWCTALWANGKVNAIVVRI